MRVSDLVEGFESSFGLDLLATVHWVAVERPSVTEDKVICDTHAWSPASGSSPSPVVASARVTNYSGGG